MPVHLLTIAKQNSKFMRSSVTCEFFNPPTDFHETWYTCYASGEHAELIRLKKQDGGCMKPIAYLSFILMATTVVSVELDT
jgi:hypothetical protein